MISPSIQFRCRDAGRAWAVSELIKHVCKLAYDKGHASLFSGCTFVVTNASPNASFAYYDSELDTIWVEAEQSGSFDRIKSLARCLGQRQWKRLPAASRLRWDMKTVPANPQTVAKVQDLVQNGEAPCCVYKKFSDAVSRLVAIHIGNALTLNGEMSYKVPLTEHPNAGPLARGEREFSLIPLLSAYAAPDLSKFEVAVADHLLGFASVNEDSTRIEFESLVKDML